MQVLYWLLNNLRIIHMCMTFQGLENNGEEFVGTYTCEADNGYSKVQVEAKLTTPDGAGTVRKYLLLEEVWCYWGHYQLW